MARTGPGFMFSTSTSTRISYNIEICWLLSYRTQSELIVCKNYMQIALFKLQIILCIVKRQRMGMQAMWSQTKHFQLKAHMPSLIAFATTLLHSCVLLASLLINKCTYTSWNMYDWHNLKALRDWKVARVEIVCWHNILTMIKANSWKQRTYLLWQQS